MGRPVKWSRDLHLIRERAQRSRVETWSRKDIEHLFNVGRATARTIMKAVGEVQNVAGAHFVERASLLRFLNDMISAISVEEALRTRLIESDAPPAPKPIRIPLPADLRSITFRELPSTIKLSSGRLVVEAASPEAILEALALLAQALQNDLMSFERVARITAPADPAVDYELRGLFEHLRSKE